MITSCNSLFITDFNSLIDSQLAPELIDSIFTHLSNIDITNACSITKNWNIASIHFMKRQIKIRFKPYIFLISKNLEAMECTRIARTIQNIQISTDFFDKITHLHNIKMYLNCKEMALSSHLKSLGIDKLKTLKLSTENIKAPLFFDHLFDKTIKALAAAPNTPQLGRIYTKHPRPNKPPQKRPKLKLTA